MSVTRLLAVGIAMLASAAMLGAQAPADRGPTVRAARTAFFAPASTRREPIVVHERATSCGSVLKNAVMLGLGFSLATSILELTYTAVREPFIRRGHDLPPADPALIAWAGGAGFVLGVVGTELCRRRQR